MLEKITQLSDSATSHGYYYDEWRRLLDQYRALTQTLPKWNYKLKQEGGISAQFIVLTAHQNASTPQASSHNYFLISPCPHSPQNTKQAGASPSPDPAESTSPFPAADLTSAESTLAIHEEILHALIRCLCIHGFDLLNDKHKCSVLDRSSEVNQQILWLAHSHCANAKVHFFLLFWY